jgi:hypothetical protein
VNVSRMLLSSALRPAPIIQEKFKAAKQQGSASDLSAMVANMIEYLEKKIQLLIDDLLTPFWTALRERLKALSWRARIVVVIFLASAYVVVANWAVIPELAKTGERMLRVVSEPVNIPMDRKLVRALRESARRLSDGLQADLDKPTEIVPQSGWTFAQILAATRGLKNVDPQTAQIYLRSVADSACACWQEGPLKQSPPNIAASGWVLFSLAEIGIPASEAELRFLLKEQQSGGWWSIFPSSGDDKYASTLATSWALLGMQNQLARRLIVGPVSTEVQSAVATGAAWLIAHREKRARWKNYPLLPIGMESDSLSGLALHALHVSAPDSIGQIEADWLEALPAVPPSAIDVETSFIWIKNTRTPDREENDHFVQIKLPWMLIATVDAYKRGDYSKRARALGWLEQTIRQESLLSADTETDDWMRSEILIAIEYLLKRVPASS